MSRSTFIDKVTGYKLPTLFKKEFGAGIFPGDIPWQKLSST